MLIKAVVTNKPYKFGGNVQNTGLIPYLPSNACVEVPCIADGNGITPMDVGELSMHLAAMNMTNINPLLLAINTTVTKKKEDVYYAAMMDPHTAAELSIDGIIKMCDEMIEAHNSTPFKVLW